MAAIPPLTKSWATVYDLLLADVSSTANIHRSIAHALLNLLLGRYTVGVNISAGYVARHADSLWTMVACSDGTQVKTDGTNLFSETFTSSEWVLSATGANPRSWYVLENTASGLQCLWAPNSTTTGWTWRFAPISTPFAGGTVDVAPASAVSFGVTNATAFNDTTTTTNRRMSVSFAPDGSFFVRLERQGTAVAQWVLGLLKTSGGDSGNAQQPYVMCHAFNASAGITTDFTITTPWSWYFTEVAAAYSTGGPARPLTVGGTGLVGSAAYGQDSTGKWWAAPITWQPIYSTSATMYDFGVIEDFYLIGGNVGLAEKDLITEASVVRGLLVADIVMMPWTAPTPT